MQPLEHNVSLHAQTSTPSDACNTFPNVYLRSSSVNIMPHFHISTPFRALHLQTSTPFRALHFTDVYTLPSTSFYRHLHPSEHFILQTSTPFRALHFTDVYTLPSTSFYRRLHPSEHFIYRHLHPSEYVILQTSTPFRARNFLRKTFPEIYILLSVMLHLVSRCQI